MGEGVYRIPSFDRADRMRRTERAQERTRAAAPARPAAPPTGGTSGALVCRRCGRLVLRPETRRNERVQERTNALLEKELSLHALHNDQRLWPLRAAQRGAMRAPLTAPAVESLPIIATKALRLQMDGTLTRCQHFSLKCGEGGA